MCFQNGRTEIYARPRQRLEPGHLIVVALHEWSHLDLGDGHHGDAFFGRLQDLVEEVARRSGYERGDISVPWFSRGPIVEYEHAVMDMLNRQLRGRDPRIVWRRLRDG